MTDARWSWSWNTMSDTHCHYPAFTTCQSCGGFTSHPAGKKPAKCPVCGEAGLPWRDPQTYLRGMEDGLARRKCDKPVQVKCGPELLIARDRLQSAEDELTRVKAENAALRAAQRQTRIWLKEADEQFRKILAAHHKHPGSAIFAADAYPVRRAIKKATP